ncbi:MAG TPA: type II toxin-antitoxin system VapC family toxin [Bryobacteraceae bacterium]|nr:type II toxin-antitoxin system VapC family toxin [Bryobacteraceae bacterium]
MSRIFWDTNLFIYLLEGSGEAFRSVNRLLSRMLERRDELLTSTLTLGEVLVKPIEGGRQEWVERYEKFLSGPGVHVIPFDRQGARVYAHLRQDRTLRAPDAIQLSCASSAGCNLFVTNDDRLSRKTVPGVDFIVPLRQVYL